MIHQQLGDDLRKEIKDDRTYNNVSYYGSSYSDADLWHHTPGCFSGKRWRSFCDIHYQSQVSLLKDKGLKSKFILNIAFIFTPVGRVNVEKSKVWNFMHILWVKKSDYIVALR